ncbi:tyrosine-type recombinase/integrase [Halorubrum pallidum]|uniref:Tyrosine-type recombinase/integrase n=1 Tax=Halorubrum pallidum TaxID=1526114 RepID=A0ABD5SZZ9_9EURY
MNTNDGTMTRSIKSTFSQFLSDKERGNGDTEGSYRRNAKRELNRFREWCAGEKPDPVNAADDGVWTGIRDGRRPVQFRDLSVIVFRQYARYLTEQDFAASTVESYYRYVSNWCGWAVTEGYLDTQYATHADATELIRNLDTSPEGRQVWTPEQRTELCRYVDKRAHDALDEWGETDSRDGDGDAGGRDQKASARFEAVKRCRERLLVYMLAYTGLRGSEFLARSDDDRDGRCGLLWERVDADDNTLRVFRKSQEWEASPLPDTVLPALTRYRELLSPPEDWPVFTTLHRPSLASHVTDALSDAGYSTDEIESIRAEKPDLLVAADHDLPAPKPLTTDGARRIMKRLCDDAAIDVDGGTHDYLAPHGGRRGISETIIRNRSFADAARFIDSTERVVREAYSHIEAGEQASMVDDVIDETDR